VFRKRINILASVLAAGDYLILVVSFLLAYYLRFGHLTGFVENQFLTFLLFIIIAWIVCSVSFRLYRNYFYQTTVSRIGLWFRCFLLFALIVIAFNGLTKTYFSRLLIGGMYSSMAVLQLSWRLSYTTFINRLLGTKLNKRKAVLIGGERLGEFTEVLNRFKLPDLDIVGYFGSKSNSGLVHLGELSELHDFLSKEAEDIDEMYCALSALHPAELNKLIEFADNNLIQVYLVPDKRGIPYRKLNIDFLAHVPLLSVRHLAIDEPLNRFIKRSFDIVFSLFVILLILSWLIPIMAVLIKLGSPGPVFFKQLRSGRNNDLFWCLKFRTMLVNSEADTKQAEKNDSRITPLGGFLRKSSIDELPQFLNVFVGDMSVVGPRPHMVSHTELYSKIISRFMVRHLVKPGITGLSQAMGLRGETREKNDMKNRVRVDIFYIENWSFWLDIKIIFMTIASLFEKQEKAF
jgi:Undecaprenyl-phosphate glucose phosphotransferase